MAILLNLTSAYKGETLTATINAKNADGTILTTPASQVVTINVYHPNAAEPMLTYGTATGEITLTDEATALFTITLDATDMEKITAGKQYAHAIWSKLGSDDPILQAQGMLILQPVGR